MNEGKNLYACTGECHGVSDKPGTCQAHTCGKHGKPLVKQKTCPCYKKDNCRCKHAQ
ncbi:hypothetical protein HUU53_01440 [Candidatus Micrarchaeota archaeon]|nr:hypothetical protein [Candidatus Micrarchaeota archaeon]